MPDEECVPKSPSQDASPAQGMLSPSAHAITSHPISSWSIDFGVRNYWLAMKAMMQKCAMWHDLGDISKWRDGLCSPAHTSVILCPGSNRHHHSLRVQLVPRSTTHQQCFIGFRVSYDTFIFSGVSEDVNYLLAITSYNQEKMSKPNYSASLKFNKLIH